jgi:hypothetical protein
MYLDRRCDRKNELSRTDSTIQLQRLTIKTCFYLCILNSKFNNSTIVKKTTRSILVY